MFCKNMLKLSLHNINKAKQTNKNIFVNNRDASHFNRIVIGLYPASPKLEPCVFPEK